MTIACPGYASYQILSSTEISVNGSKPVWSATSSQTKKILENWQQYGSYVRSASKETGIPISWILAIMAIESGGDPNACSPCEPQWCSFYPNCQPCCAYGLMQFIDQTAKIYGATGKQLLGNPRLAILLAARLMRDIAKRHGMDLIKIAASYNAGSPRCSGQGTFGLTGQHDYAMNAVRSANTVIALRIPAWPTVNLLWWAIGGAAAVAAVMIAPATLEMR